MINFNIKSYIYFIPAIIIAMTVHGYVQALMSKRAGDFTPVSTDRLTFNPLKQIEILGFLLMLFWGFGWSKPMDTNPFYYENYKKGTISVYIVPSLFNLLLGMFVSLIAKIFFFLVIKETFEFNFIIIHQYDMIGINTKNCMIAVYYFLTAIALANIQLALFNIIPIYPLDGSKVLYAFMPYDIKVKYIYYEKIFQVILLLLLLGGAVGMILYPLCNALTF